MLMMAAFTIVTIAVFAQNNTTKFPQEQLTKSNKELMKMEVMKIPTYSNVFVTTSEYSKNDLVTNLSIKEQMKTSVIKVNAATQYQDIASNKSDKCPACFTLSNLSPKEQMKMKVMDLFTCPMGLGTPGHSSDKCSICGMDLTANK